MRLAAPARVRAILEATASEHGVTVGEIIAHDRKKRISAIRDLAIFRVRQLKNGKGLPVSTPQIGGWFDRDHTSIIAAIRRQEAREMPVDDGKLPVEIVENYCTIDSMNEPHRAVIEAVLSEKTQEGRFAAARRLASFAYAAAWWPEKVEATEEHKAAAQ